MSKERIISNMKIYGGHFVKALAWLYELADATNKEIIEESFSHYFEEYSKF